MTTTTAPRRPQGLRKTVAKPEYLVTAKPDPPKKKTKRGRKKGATKKVAKNKVQPEEYVVEKVLEVKKTKGNRVLCLIKWEGYEETTWEPISNLNTKAKKDAKILLEALEPAAEEETKEEKGEAAAEAAADEAIVEEENPAEEEKAEDQDV